MNRNIKNIPFAKPSLGAEEEEAVVRVLRSGWLTTGKEARNFETEFASFVGSSYALALNSATAGLHLSLEALGIGPGDLVITTPYTFTASAEIIRYLGADPLFVDIEKSSFNMDPGALKNALEKHNKKVKAILPVHLAGLPCPMDELMELSRLYKIPVVEDGAHAFPVKYKEKTIGTFGKTGVYSFYANKTITTGEGGMIVTDDEELARRISIMRLHGINKVSWDRYTKPGASWFYEVVEAGYKYNLTDIAAAIGRVQLSKAEDMKAKRKKIAEVYLKELAPCDFLILPEKGIDHAWHLFILRLNEEKMTIMRDEFVEILARKGIGSSVHYIPLHIMPYYKAQYNFSPGDFPIAYENYKQSFSIPIYPDLTKEDLYYIINVIKELGSRYSR